MFRALFIKEWTQLRTLRWVGFGLGALLPLFLLAGAEASRQGWFAGGISANYDTRTVFVSAMPRFLVGVWGFLALLVAGQVFIGRLTTSSWSVPNDEAPLASSSPTTSQVRLFSRIISPIGLVFPNRFWRTVSPRMQTDLPDCSSLARNERPMTIGQSTTSRYRLSVPTIDVEVLSAP